MIRKTLFQSEKNLFYLICLSMIKIVFVSNFQILDIVRVELWNIFEHLELLTLHKSCEIFSRWRITRWKICWTAETIQWRVNLVNIQEYSSSSQSSWSLVPSSTGFFAATLTVLTITGRNGQVFTYFVRFLAEQSFSQIVCSVKSFV